VEIGYYFCTAKTERNRQFPIHVLVNFDKDWPEGVLRQRALLGNRFFTREATTGEIEVHQNHKRAQSYKYQSFAALLEDEQRSCPSREFLQGLQQAWDALKLDAAA